MAFNTVSGLVQRDKLESDRSVTWPLVIPRVADYWADVTVVGSEATAVATVMASDQDPEEQWLFQFHEHMLLTVQAIHRLHQALSERMLGQ